METQQNLALDDPHARTQSEGVDVVYASASGSERFHRDSLFGGFSSMRALTYTPSIPMILALLRDYDYEDFECICGYYGVGPDEERYTGLDPGRYGKRIGSDRPETRPLGIVSGKTREAPEAVAAPVPKLKWIRCKKAGAYDTIENQMGDDSAPLVDEEVAQCQEIVN